MKRTLQILIAAAMLLCASPAAFAQEAGPKIPAYWSVSGFINSQYSYVPSQTSTFFIRHARLDLKGFISDKLEFRLQTEFSGNVRLVDAHVKCKFHKCFNVEVGQFKTPFTLESQYSLLKKEGIDYAQVISKLSGYSDILPGNRTNGRDIGVMVYGALLESEPGGYPLLSYNVGVFNGSGINRKDDNLGKDIIARLDIHPFVKDLVLSASMIRGTYAEAANSEAANNRFSFGGEYKSDVLTVRSEYVRADVEAGGALSTTDGFYVAAGYWLPFVSGFRLRPILRYDSMTSAGSPFVLYMSGLDCWPWGNLRLQTCYTLCTDGTFAAPSHLLQAMVSVKF